MSTKAIQLAIFSIPLAMGCGAQFEGTWLFQWDRSSKMVLASDQCGEEESGMEYQGDEYEWIDIYSTTGGALVLTNGAQEWVGTVTGDEFSVESTYGESDGVSYFQRNHEINASLSGEDLKGSGDVREIIELGEGECRRQTRRSFVGVKMEGTDDTSRTIGTQSSQSAAAN
jgi:hypothetical protein